MANVENSPSSLQRPGRPGIQEIRDEFPGKFPFDAFSFDIPAVTDPRLILTGYRLMVGISSYGSKTSEQVGAGIIEVGSNSNGTWIKFSDGTMMEYGERNETFPANTLTYKSSVYNFPKNFIAKPFVTAMQNDSHGDLNAGAPGITFGAVSPGSGLTAVGYTIGIRRWEDFNLVYNVTIQWLAIGKWK